MAQEPNTTMSEEKSAEKATKSDPPVWVVKNLGIEKHTHYFPKIDEKAIISGITTNRVFGYGFEDSSVLQSNKNGGNGFVSVGAAARSFSEDGGDGLIIPNQMVRLLHAAFMQHLPIQLRPDDLFLMVAQGLAIHIFENAEKLKKHMVDFDDKARIDVIDDSLRIGSDSNDWTYVLNTFSEGCEKMCKLKNFIKTVECDFGTSTRVTSLASKCTVFKGMSKYVSFHTHTRSGIPEIRLIGETKDWKRLLDKLNAIRGRDELAVQFWMKQIGLIFTNIYDTVDCLADKKPLDDKLVSFWKSIYNFRSRSGGCSISGWISKLFPYLSEENGSFKRNKFDDGNTWMGGYEPGSFGPSYTLAPMTWHYMGTIIECDMVGGIVGISQNVNDGCLMPVSGWMVIESERNKKK